MAEFWRGHWNTPVQELLSVVVAASGARGGRRSAVWLLSLALHLCGLGFLLLPCPAAAFAGSDALPDARAVGVPLHPATARGRGTRGLWAPPARASTRFFAAKPQPSQSMSSRKASAHALIYHDGDSAADRAATARLKGGSPASAKAAPSFESTFVGL